MTNHLKSKAKVHLGFPLAGTQWNKARSEGKSWRPAEFITRTYDSCKQVEFIELLVQIVGTCFIWSWRPVLFIRDHEKH